MGPYKEQAIQYFQSIGIPPEEGLANLNKILGKKILIKIGGDCLTNGGYDSIGKSLADLYELRITPTIVHGGGTQISEAIKRRGLKSRFVNGLRMVPDDPEDGTMDGVIEGLTEVNDGLVSAINRYAGKEIAVGLMHEKVVYAEKHPLVVDKDTGQEVDLGLVGIVKRFDADGINSYIEKRKIPILWCIGYSIDGQRYNINADMVGEALAPNYVKYVLLTSVGGYLEDGKIVAEMTLEQAKKHKAQGGMSIKLDSAIEVLENTTLDLVQIASPENLPFELFTNKGRGTMIIKKMPSPE